MKDPNNVCIDFLLPYIQENMKEDKISLDVMTSIIQFGTTAHLTMLFTLVGAKLFEYKDENKNNILHLVAQAGLTDPRRQAMMDFLVSKNAAKNLLDQRNEYGLTPVNLGVKSPSPEPKALERRSPVLFSGNPGTSIIKPKAGKGKPN